MGPMRSMVSDRTCSLVDERAFLKWVPRGVWCRTEHAHFLMKEHFQSGSHEEMGREHFLIADVGRSLSLSLSLFHGLSSSISFTH